MSEKPPILNILVVGFHHKKGCQVEFSYPPLIAGTEGKNECPSGWKYLPTLGLPDGSHNFAEDTVFFNLPSLNDPAETVYGVSCYRQIPVEKLKIRTADVTRSTVQKAVCILSRLPIYGYIEVKLSLIADAFFEQGDFEYTDILIKAYNQLNACLQHESRPLRHFYVGLPIREITLKWRHKLLILVKLFMLQKRVVCFGSPVRPMCTLILGVSSLIPRLLEKGFQEVACVRTSRPMSPMPDFSIPSNDESQTPNQTDEKMSVESCTLNEQSEHYDNKSTNINFAATPKKEPATNRILERGDSNGIEVGKRLDRSNSLTRESSVDTLASSLFPLSSVNPDAYRSPITIFASGHLCLPYLSLPYMDLLSDQSVLSYVIGTSNVLFQQKKNLADIQIDIENGTMETSDPELRRELVLTTEDLRFVDYIIRHVQSPKEDAEGSEHWIREQFQGYMLALLKTASMQDNQKDCDHFNSHFMSTFKKTQCFQEWYDVRPDESFFEALPIGHPFAGTLSVADMKLKIAQTMHNSESGRKLNQAVNTTSKAVGGAITQAKGAFSNWWSSITTVPLLNPPNSDTFHGSLSNLENESNQNNDDTKPEHNYEQVPADSADESDNSFGGDVQEFIEDDLINIKTTDGIVEIGKEAEMLDAKKNSDVFIV